MSDNIMTELNEMTAEISKLRAKNARLTREREQLKERLVGCITERANLTCERDAARAHFRRACEIIEREAINNQHDPTAEYPPKPADVWQVEIMVEVNKEGCKKP